MINELYTFSPGSFVVADEWNANFSTLNKASQQHQEAIQDANNSLAFPNSDLSNVFNAVKTQPNSFNIQGNSIDVSVEQEYYKTLTSGQNLLIIVPSNMNGSVRILIKIPDNRNNIDDIFKITYSGTKDISYGYYNYNYFRSGFYYIMIHESNNLAQVKLIWTGV